MDCREVLNLIEDKSKVYGAETAHCKEIREDMDDFQVNVVVVGGFSAGKSALLNALMGTETLKEGQRPETAIASELVYDADEYVEAFSGGTAERMRMDEARELDAERYDFLRWHLRNETLAGLRGYTLVDMPGFNSGIQAHNKAILRYSEKASAYLLVIDAEDGGIKQSMGDFMREIRNYEHNEAIVVSKCDLKTQEDAAQISANVAASAELLFGEAIPVVSTSKFDTECPQKLDALIRGFDRDKLFCQRFAPRIQDAGESLISTLELKKKGAKLNAAELEDEIAKRENAKKDFEKALRQKRSELAEQYGYQEVSSVMGEAEAALSNEAASLAASLKSGNHAFNARVNAILRPVLMNAVKSFTDQSYEKLASQITSAEDASSQIPNEAEEQWRMRYRAVTGVLAVGTEVVASWLEVLIILLPDILRFLSNGTRSNPQEELESRVRGEIIPQIVRKLQPDIEGSLREIQEQMLNELEENARERMDEDIRVLGELKGQLQARQEEHSRELDAIDADIRLIREAINSL